MDNAEIYELVLGHFDSSPSKVAKLLNMPNPSAVSMWRQRGIPAEYAKRLETACGVSVKVMRPHDWQLYWPEPQPKRRKATEAAQ